MSRQTKSAAMTALALMNMEDDENMENIEGNSFDNAGNMDDGAIVNSRSKKSNTYGKSNSSSSNNINPKNLPPSHPGEQFPEHRAFLIRSLDRNDADLGALIDLNRTIRAVKHAILQTCGEVTLLDLGAGKLRLSDEGDGLEVVLQQQPATTTNNKKNSGDNNNNYNNSSRSKDAVADAILPETKEGQELCVDFLLRMKLRTKLLNRLARRLNRIAHAMDGQDVGPPNPPRYGDLRLHIDEEAVEAFEQHFARQEQARKTIEKERQKYVYELTTFMTTVAPIVTTSTDTPATTAADTSSSPPEETITSSQPETATSPAPEKETKEGTEPKKKEGTSSLSGEKLKPKDTKKDEDSDEEEDHDDDDENDDEEEVDESSSKEGDSTESKTKTDDDTKKKDNDSGEEKVAVVEEKDNKTASPDNKTQDLATTPDGPTSSAKIDNDLAVPPTTVPSSEVPAEGPPPISPPKTTSSAAAVSSSSLPPQQVHVYHHASRNIDYEALKTFNDAYEKIIDPVTGEVKYTILADPASTADGGAAGANGAGGPGTTQPQQQPDHLRIKYNGIGATDRGMSGQEKAQEYQRWQNNILARIPEQPTFDQLGLSRRVFLLQARRKRARESDKQRKKEEAEKQEAEAKAAAEAAATEEAEVKAAAVTTPTKVTSEGGVAGEGDLTPGKSPGKKLKVSNERSPGKKLKLETEEEEKESDTSKIVDVVKKAEEEDDKRKNPENGADDSDSDDNTSKDGEGQKMNNQPKDGAEAKQDKQKDADNDDDMEMDSQTDDENETKEKETNFSASKADDKSNSDDHEKGKSGANCVRSLFPKSSGDKPEASTKERNPKDEEGVDDDDSNDDDDNESSSSSDLFSDGSDKEDEKEKSDAKKKVFEDLKKGSEAGNKQKGKGSKVSDDDNDSVTSTSSAEEGECTEKKRKTKGDDNKIKKNDKKRKQGEGDEMDSESDCSSKSDEQEDDEKIEEKKSSDSDSDSDLFEVSDAEDEEKPPETGSEKQTTTVKESEDEKDEEEEEEEEEIDFVDAFKRAKPVALSAIPSFYDQDLKRIKTIHAELMAASMHEHAKRRLEEVTAAYNSALRHSKELNDGREKAENDLKAILYAKNGLMHKINEYNAKLAHAKKQWEMHCAQKKHEKLNAMLPSRIFPNRQFPGSVAATRYMMRPDGSGISAIVGSTVSDVVESICGVMQGHLPHLRSDVPLQLPPRPPEYEAFKQQERVEATLRQNLQIYAQKLRAAEEERHRAWRKMMKTKSEFDVPHYQTTNFNGQKKKVVVDLNNHSMFPVPSLPTCKTEYLPQEVTAVRQVLPSYVPTVNRTVPLALPPGTAEETVDSKYSAARVKERISTDGTVAPVTAPKQGKDGLYLRPAGRTRKGMEWDAVRGIWVPAGTL